MKKLLTISAWEILAYLAIVMVISCKTSSKTTKDPEVKIVYKEKIVYRDTCDYDKWAEMQRIFVAEVDSYYLYTMDRLVYNKDSMERGFLHWRDSALFVADSLAMARIDSITAVENKKLEQKWDSVRSDIAYFESCKVEIKERDDNLAEASHKVDSIIDHAKDHIQAYINSSNSFSVVNSVVINPSDTLPKKAGFDPVTLLPYLYYGEQ